MKTNYIFLSLLLFVTLSVSARKSEVNILRSPDKRYELHINPVKGEGVSYSVRFNGEEIVEKSTLGVDIAGSAWGADFEVLGTKKNSVKSSWNPPYGERSVIKDVYNELTLELGSAQSCMNIVFRAYDEGVAYKYEFVKGATPQMIISTERSTFTMPKGTKVYYSTWAQGPYELLPLEGWEKDAERPLTMLLESGVWVAVGEANMVDYARSRFNLDPTKANTLITKLASEVEFTTPYSTPWRTIMAAEEAIELINNNDLFLNLSDESKVKSTDWIRPGKVFRTGLTQAEGLASVDFAADRGLQYVHFDAGWYGPERADSSDARAEFPEKDIKLKEVCEYAKSKGIGVLLYVNQRHLHRQLDEILPIYKEWGIKGLKFGFVNVGSQKDTKWLHEAVAKCAEYEMIVDIHDEYRPTGVSRTYPNLLTQEGIRGNEEMPDPFNNLILPYTRFLCGAGDYTPCYFSNRIKTTRAHQLAMVAVYYSPLQFLFWYDRPSLYRGEKELEFWAAAPTTWDDSRAIAGEPGEYIVMARRTSDDWMVGAMTNGERKVSVDTSKFLDAKGEYEVSIYQDNPSLGTRTNIEIVRRRVSSGEVLEFDLLWNGGVALHFVKSK